MHYWLIKSEGSCYSIDDLKKDKRTSWTGVRNFQARNYMRDGMKIGDLVLFYHSNDNPSGVYGIAKVVSKPHIDESALDLKDEHYDAKAVKYKKEGKEPLWVCVDVAFVKKLKNPVSLDFIKHDSGGLSRMLVAKPGQRLSVMPMAKEHFERVEKMG